MRALPSFLAALLATACTDPPRRGGLPPASESPDGPLADAGPRSDVQAGRDAEAGAGDTGRTDTGCPPEPCEEGESPCGCECADLAAAPAHCGECGRACGEGQVCVAGECADGCPQGSERCEGEQECSDLASSPWHCGRCGHGCRPGDECHAGECGERCEATERWCGGRCLDVTSDPLNCGDCGVACDPQEEACREGECGYRCEQHEVICGGACADLAVNVHHCGGCGQRCAMNQDCVRAECVLACGVTLTRCGDVCADTMRSVVHCGGCDRACDAHVVCRQGVCACEDPALLDCGDRCVDPQTDGEHCGGCDNPCPEDQVCSGGECTCELEGWGVCGGRCVDMRHDAQHCGECGEQCDDGVECVFGHCGGPEIFQGVRTNVPEVELEGWEQCWSGRYGASGVSVRNEVLTRCDGPWLLLACRPVDAASLSVMAMGLREDVLFECGNGNLTTHTANGVNWYFSDSYSWGFVVAPEPVSRSSCDTAGSRAETRLCWHTGGGNMNGGYRCGAQSGLNGSQDWERLVYHVPP